MSKKLYWHNNLHSLVKANATSNARSEIADMGSTESQKKCARKMCLPYSAEFLHDSYLIFCEQFCEL